MVGSDGTGRYYYNSKQIKESQFQIHIVYLDYYNSTQPSYINLYI